jgi:type I restriction enzyme S subunit
MGSEWREFCIGEIAEVIGGSTPSTTDPANFDGSIPWITPRDLANLQERYVSRGERNLSPKGLASCSAKLLPPGSVLLSSRAPIGYVAIAKNPLATNQGCRSLVLRDGFDSGFIYYWLKCNTSLLEQHANGTTFKEISGSSLRRIRLCSPPPPLPEQRATQLVLEQAETICKDWVEE